MTEVPSMALVDSRITGVVIRSQHVVFNALGGGLPENVYCGALAHECGKHGLHVEREVRVPVHYDSVIVGTFRVDLLIKRQLVVEVKIGEPHPDHRNQVLNYLRCSRVELGLLLYFGDKPIAKRFIYRNELKAIQGLAPADRRGHRADDAKI